MKPLRLSVAFYLFLVFLSGVVVGGLAHRFYTVREVRAERKPRSSEEYRRNYIEEMNSRLALNESQVRQLNEILDATRSRYREMRERLKPELKSIQQEQVEKIRAILSPNQVAEYEKMRAERDSRRGQDRKHHR